MFTESRCCLTKTLVWLGLALTFASNALYGFEKPKLGEAQVRRLVKIAAPDDVITHEIRDRGLAFVPTERIIEDLRRLGAGTQTLSLLQALIPEGTVEIQTQAGAQVLIDETPAGSADRGGRLVVNHVEAGKHRLFVQKSGYAANQSEFSLAGKEDKRLPVELQWTGGFLTVRTNPSGAVVNIAGLGEYRDGVTDVLCPPGSYRLTVTRKGMKPETQVVVVVAGQHADVDVRLTPDPEYLRTTMADARQHLGRGETQSAISELRELLALAPNDLDATSVLAIAYLRARDPENFQVAATESLTRGGAITIELAHEHLQLSGESIHPAAITLTATSIAYDPEGAPCKYGNFIIPFSDLESVGVTNAPPSFIVRHLGPGTFLLRLEERDPKKRKGKMSLEFATEESQIDVENGVHVLVSPRGSAQILNAVARLIRSQASAGESMR